MLALLFALFLFAGCANDDSDFQSVVPESNSEQSDTESSDFGSPDGENGSSDGIENEQGNNEENNGKITDEGKWSPVVPFI